MTSFAVNFTEMYAVVTALGHASQKVQGELDNLEATVANLIQTWEGEAQTQYVSHQAKWDAAAQRMHAVLGRATQALDVINENYISTEKGVAGSWL